jgi:hypothetical protein
MLRVRKFVLEKLSYVFVFDDIVQRSESPAEELKDMMKRYSGLSIEPPTLNPTS